MILLTKLHKEDSKFYFPSEQAVRYFFLHNLLRNYQDCEISPSIDCMWKFM